MHSQEIQEYLKGHLSPEHIPRFTEHRQRNLMAAIHSGNFLAVVLGWPYEATAVLLSLLLEQGETERCYALSTCRLRCMGEVGDTEKEEWERAYRVMPDPVGVKERLLRED